MNADALIHWLLRTSLEASLLILAVLGLRLMLGTRLSPAWRIGLWLLVGTKLMLPAFIPAGFGLGAWFQQGENAATGETVVTLRGGAAEAGAVAAGSERPVSQAGPHAATSAWRPTAGSVVLGLWGCGGAFVLLAAIYQQQRFQRALSRRPQASAPLLCSLVASLGQKAGVRQPVRILLMPAGTTPALVGVVRPCILLPEDWEARFDEGSLRHVLLHELLHIKNHDLVWNWAAVAVQALHWYNPLVWLVVAHFQADRELRCDAGALALLGPTERLDYGHTLLRIQETFFAPPAMAGLAPCVRNHPALRQRILMIAQPTTRQPVIQALLTATLGVLVCYSFTTARAVEKEVPEKVRTRGTSRSEGPTPTASPQDSATRTTETARGREGGEGERKTGMRDGEGSRSGGRDGEKPRTGMRDGEGSRSGARDGEKPRTGMRDGEGSRSGGRDGDGAGKTNTREGDAAATSGETIKLKVIKGGEAVLVGEEEIAMNRLRGHLHRFLPEHAGAKVFITGEGDVPMSAMLNTLDAVRDNGNKNVSLQTE